MIPFLYEGTEEPHLRSKYLRKGFKTHVMKHLMTLLDVTRERKGDRVLIACVQKKATDTQTGCKDRATRETERDRERDGLSFSL